MTDRITNKIIAECTRIERDASELYRSFVGVTDKKRIQKFWKEMSDEENEHIAYWESLAELAKTSKLPEILDDAERTLEELEEINVKLVDFKKRYSENPSLYNAFLLAYRIEYFLLHPVFATFFQYMRPKGLDIDPAEKYDEHLHKFVDAVSKFGSQSPELDLLGETLERIWKRNIELAQQNSTDFLTGIFNRRGFFAAMKPLSHLSQRNNQNVAIMLVDLDDFKQINDRLGHETGDRVLKKVAKIIRSSVRTSDLVARYGGEEFIVFLSTVGRDAVEMIAEKVRGSIESKTKGITRVTASIGVADGTLPRDVATGLEELIRQADESLYKAKQGGKNRIVCKPAS